MVRRISAMKEYDRELKEEPPPLFMGIGGIAGDAYFGTFVRRRGSNCRMVLFWHDAEDQEPVFHDPFLSNLDAHGIDNFYGAHLIIKIL